MIFTENPISNHLYQTFISLNSSETKLFSFLIIYKFDEN